MSLSTAWTGQNVGRPNEVAAECRLRIIEAERSLSRARQSLDALIGEESVNGKEQPEPCPPEAAIVSTDDDDHLGHRPAQIHSPAEPSMPQQCPDTMPKASSETLTSKTETNLKSSCISEANRVQHALVDQVIIDDIAPSTKSATSFKKELHQETRGMIEAPEQEVRKLKRTQSKRVEMHPVCSGRLRVPVVHPEAKFKIVWMIIGFIGILYEACAIPFYLAFRTQAEGIWIIVNGTVNAYFIVDIPLSFMSGFRDETGGLHMNPRVIAVKYLISWFAFDLFAAIPWEWIDSSSDGEALSDYSVLKSCRLLKAIRMLRLLRLLHFMKSRDTMENAQIHLESNAAFGAAVGVLRTVVIAFTVTHWCACLWYHIGMGSVLPHEVSWIDLHLGNYPEIAQRYAVSLYFTLTTMTTVGYGDLHPQTITEMQFGMLLLCMATVVFAALMGTLTDIIHNMNSKSHELAGKKEQLGGYMRWRAVPHTLSRHIRQHLVYLWDDQSFQAYEDEIRQQLSPVLRAELSEHIYGPMIYTAPFLAWMWDYDACVKHLANLIQSNFLEHGDYIFRKGDQDDTIYILVGGSVWISSNSHLQDESDVGTAHRTRVHYDGRTVLQLPREKKMTSFRKMASFKSLTNSASCKVGRSLRNVSHEKDRDDSEKAPATIYGIETTGHKLFDSEMILYAVLEQRRQDIRKKRAATKLQRWWKRYLTTRLVQMTSAIIKGSGKAGVLRMASRMVVAPAYFGESCLWFPIEDWQDHTPVCMYNAQCQSRTEVVCIPRSAVLSVLEHFSPWLGERFEGFRLAVISRLSPAGTQAPSDTVEDGPFYI